MRTKTLWIRDPYLAQLLTGRKVVEVRVSYSNIQRLQAGDLLLLNEQHPFRILNVRRYASFEELLAHENPAQIAPDLPKEELLSNLHDLYPSEKEALGVIALHLAAQ